jgi:hypothetical protein
MEHAFPSCRGADRCSVVGPVVTTNDGREASHWIGDKDSRTNQTNARRCDQRRNCTGIYGPLGASAQPSGGTRVEHAGHNEVGPLLPPSVTIPERTHGVSTPVIPRPPCPDRREGDDEQWSGKDSAPDLSRKLGSLALRNRHSDTLLRVALGTGHEGAPDRRLYR